MSDDSKLLAAVSYILGILAIILWAVKKEDKFIRFHAMQATLYSVSVIIILIAFNILTFVLGIVTGGLGSFIGCLAIPLGLGALAFDLYVAYKAYNGEEYEIPVIGSFARSYI